MSTEKSKKSFAPVILVLLSVPIIGLLVFVFAVLSQTNTSNTSTGEEKVSVDSVTCTMDDAKNSASFFDTSKADNAITTIKVVVKDNKLDSISYALDASYGNDLSAKNAESDAHAHYNLYMQNNELDAESLSPSFSHKDAKTKIGLYIDKKKINDTTAKIFFLDSANQTKNTSIEKIASIYKQKGFVCKINNHMKE